MTSCPRCGRSFEDGVRFCPVDGALVTQAVQDPNVGRVLMGQFELREIAGRGAMGTVYRAYQRTMDRVVAVKILRSEIVKEPGVLRRFLREARAAAKLQHPNIVTVHMVGETEDGVPYLVMEHIDGVSLEAICEAQGPQAMPRVTWFGRQIASALSEAHNLGIVHRDLKPANILVTDRSRTPDLVKVLDFGIAKIVHGEGPDQSMVTADGTIFGTPHYIAPEQASGGDVDHRVDLYSLGVILFRLTTGALPFEGTQSMQVVLKHLREEPPRPRELDPSIPVAMEELILSCLAKNRARRPEDADQVIAELDRIDAGLTSNGRTIKGMPIKRTDAGNGRSPVETLAPVHAPQKTPVWATGAAAPSASQRVRAATPSQGTRASTPSQGTRAVSGRTPPGGTRTVTARMAAQRRTTWRNRTVWAGVFLAATVGATLGVLLALTHNSLDESAPPAPEHPMQPRSARAHVPPASITVTSVTPRAATASEGSGASPSGAPANGAAASGAAASGANASNGAPVSSATTNGVAGTGAPASSATANGAAAQAGEPRVDAANETRGRAPGKPVAALHRHARHDDSGDDLPVTVVPADDPTPRVVAHPLPVTRSQPARAPGASPPSAAPPQPAPQPQPSPPSSSPSPPPVAVPSQPAPQPPRAPQPAPQPAPSAPDPAPPVARPQPPQAAPPRDDEPPPSPPPPANDPTTLPAPPPSS